MGVWITDSENEGRDLRCNWWSWRPTVELLIGSGIEPEFGWALASDGVGAFTAEEVGAMAGYLETSVLPSIADGLRVKLDGSTTAEPDDGTFHRHHIEENYSASYEWLVKFVEFLKSCRGGIYLH